MDRGVGWRIGSAGGLPFFFPNTHKHTHTDRETQKHLLSTASSPQSAHQNAFQLQKMARFVHAHQWGRTLSTVEGRFNVTFSVWRSHVCRRLPGPPLWESLSQLTVQPKRENLRGSCGSIESNNRRWPFSLCGGL